MITSIIEKKKVTNLVLYPDSEFPKRHEKANNTAREKKEKKGKKGYKSSHIEYAPSRFGIEGRLEYAPPRFEGEENFDGENLIEELSVQAYRTEDSQPGAFSIAGPGIMNGNNDQAEESSNFSQETLTGERIIEAHLAPNLESMIEEALEKKQRHTDLPSYDGSSSKIW